MNNCVFTIVAKNYIGVAQILEESLKSHNPDVNFFIVVADEFEDIFDKNALPGNVLIAREKLEISAERWLDMSFKYDLTEFCTAIKPKCFEYLFNNTTAEKVVFLDPDIYIYSSFDTVFEMLEEYSVVLTPHISIMREHYIGELAEEGLMGNGFFNLGFCALKRDKKVQKLLVWWNEKLLNKCYIDPYTNQFTDQKWMDFLPSFFNSDELLITRHLGMNIAPWNFFERKISLDSGVPTVSARENEDNDVFSVIFVHYSGYNYKELKKGNIVQNNITSLTNYPDIKFLLNVYAKAIENKVDEFDKFIEEKYSYSKFNNGDEIKKFHRRLYRSLTNKGEIINNPFAVGKETFHALLLQAGMTKAVRNINIDKVTRNSVEKMGSKLIVFNKLSRLCYRILGFERYILMIRLLRPFSRYESQIHLLKKQYDKENITF